MGGLYSVTALRENDQERVTVFTKHRLKLHPQTTLTNDGGLKNLDTRGDGGRVGEIILHIGGSAVAPGKIDMTITSFPVATALFTGPKLGGRQT